MERKQERRAMELVVKGEQEFHFHSACTSPYASTPASPKRFGDPFDYLYHYTSAPTSPTHAAAIYAEFSKASNTISSSMDALDWEEKLATTTKPSADDDDTDEFDFTLGFSRQLEKGGPPPVFTTADELFEKGKIRPMKPPSQVQPKGSSSPRGHGREKEVRRDRGRERTPLPPSTSSSRSRRGTRSLSPMRGNEGLHQKLETTTSPSAITSSPTTTIASILKGGGSKKWRLRDLLLFRSASEGRATGRGSKDPLRKYTLLPSSSSSSPLPPLPSKKRTTRGEDSKSSSFRSTDSGGSVRRGSSPAVSAHELHYTANRAASEELKKKTPLPYRQGFLACLRFNPAAQGVVRGVNGYSINYK